jgi:hypothetical protein
VLRFLIRFGIFPVLLYFLGMAWFMTSLPAAAGPERTDGIVVLTGGPGRLSRGFELIAGRRGRPHADLGRGRDGAAPRSWPPNIRCRWS